MMKMRRIKNEIWGNGKARNGNPLLQLFSTLTFTYQVTAYTSITGFQSLELHAAYFALVYQTNILSPNVSTYRKACEMKNIK